jgi:LysM repeat protein
MNPETNTSYTKVCPTCGTRNSESATRCSVCGRNFTPIEIKSKKAAVQGPRMPEITLSLPVALGLMVVVLAIGAAVVFAVLQKTGTAVTVEKAITPTITVTATHTQIPTSSPTSSPIPTFTPLPPKEYVVKQGDYCSTIAAIFNVSINSIVLLNNLPADCSALSVGQKLLIPQPTPTASPMPSATLSGAEATDVSCPKDTYVVKGGDTLGGIAQSYNVSMDSIRDYNGLTGDLVYEGQKLSIPLCQRLPTAGPTPTATLPPPYPAPNLLLPADGSVFTGANDTITLQWASVGTLRDNEAYQVTIDDVTDGTGRRLVEYVTDTKFIIPVSYRPSGNNPHIIRWVVTSVRQAGVGQDGQPIWVSNGTISTPRVFSWQGGTQTNPTPSK